MEGVCTYSGTMLTMTVDAIGGSGTAADWVFSIAGNGDLRSTNNLSDVANAATACTNLGAVGVIKKQVFAASGTYTPSANMLHCIIECVGGGGGGGGSAGTSGSIYGGGGGGSGAYSRLLATAATIGASQTVTIGAAGTGGATGANNGTAGGDTSVGTLCIGKGGAFGGGGSSASSGIGGLGGVAGTGDIAAAGNSAFNGVATGTLNPILPSGAGAASFFGGLRPACKPQAFRMAEPPAITAAVGLAAFPSTPQQPLLVVTAPLVSSSSLNSARSRGAADGKLCGGEW
jgi:hypothetical protein